MSTFKGIVAEFPQIRIDYFRHQPGHKAPLACFLSHVHSDHLTGLESLRAPFVYCSAATREILLRLEKYHYRVNFAHGILESRNVTYDRSMRRLAKPLPLDTPTIIELTPETKIRVTLLDANHCVGAVMFLIEGDGKAILYTGDIRAETWWVNSIVQNPVLLPYTYGSRRLDCVYLDTTFATKSEPYREFPSKADGIRELLEKVSKYPPDTIFYFHSWTFGYENVWIALSAFLDSQIHLDSYRSRIYNALSCLKNKQLRESGIEIREASSLCGFMNGNHFQPGCLTANPQVRLHSCERGMGCPVVDRDTSAKIVSIVPIVTRTNGIEIAEIGAGGGKGDMDQKEELDTGDVAAVGKLMELCASNIDDAELLSKVLAVLQNALERGEGKIDLGMSLHKESQGSEDDLSVQSLVSVLSNQVSDQTEFQHETIRFPYSRHSSYSELCTLVGALKPKDVFPCTVDENTWTPDIGMRGLFAEYCSADIFRHNAEMMEIYERRLERELTGKRNVDTQTIDTDIESQIHESPKKANVPDVTITPKSAVGQEETHFVTLVETPNKNHHSRRPSVEIIRATETSASIKRERGPSLASQAIADTLLAPSPIPGPKERTPSLTENLFTQTPAFTQSTPRAGDHTTSPPPSIPEATSRVSNPSVSTPDLIFISSSETSRVSRKRPRKSNKRFAYEAALGGTWADYGGLVSARRGANDEGSQEL